MAAGLSWMERATLLHEQLGLRAGQSVRVRSRTPSVREEPTLIREEPTVAGEAPTLVREEPTLVNEEPTLEFRSDYVDEADISDVSEIDDVIQDLARDLYGEVAEEVRNDELFGDDSRSSDLEIPDFRQRTGGIGVVVAFGAVIALAVAAVVTHPFGSRTRPTAGISALRVPEQPVPLTLPEPHNPEPATVHGPTTPENGTVQMAPLELAPIETARAKASNAALVTVKVIPSAAVIFRAGEKLGAGSVQLSVGRTGKQRLTALHDGYLPYNFTVDGSRETVTVRLRRAPRPHAAETPVSDSPSAVPSEDSAGATPPPSPAATAPESTP
jgi:hypothetical protein